MLNVHARHWGQRQLIGFGSVRLLLSKLERRGERKWKWNIFPNKIWQLELLRSCIKPFSRNLFFNNHTPQQHTSNAQTMSHVHRTLTYMRNERNSENVCVSNIWDGLISCFIIDCVCVCECVCDRFSSLARVCCVCVVWVEATWVYRYVVARTRKTPSQWEWKQDEALTILAR